MVINIASDSEHADESACSLNFGQRMAIVESRASTVVGSDAGSERTTSEAALAALQAEIAQLEAAGHAGGESACTASWRSSTPLAFGRVLYGLGAYGCRD